MKSLTTVILLSILVVARGAEQVLLSSNHHEYGSDNTHHQFTRPINRVAIVGAGVGGLIAYRELTEAGLSVHIFERDSVPGGNWHYTEEPPEFAPVPNRHIAEGDYVPSLPPVGVELPYAQIIEEDEAGIRARKREHRAPKPVWDSLTSNAPAPIQQIRELPWPAGTPWALHNRKLQGYLRAFASFHGLNSNDGNPNISYNTRVELVKKHIGASGEENGWDLTVSTLEEVKTGVLKVVWRKEHFDAIIVATGRYNAPNMPNIPGLQSLVEHFPAHIQHSRAYRVPLGFRNQTVLIVGAATSGGEISREIIRYAKQVYQSVRPESSPIPQRPQADFLRRLPHNVTLIGEIKRFVLPTSRTSEFSETKIELANGTIISGIDHIIFATGFRYSYPFLPLHHNPKLGLNDSVPRTGSNRVQPIVTDGTHLRSLYLDAWYIPDPTLLFINANFGMQSFTHAEFVALAAAKIWTRTADLPNTDQLWKAYDVLYFERRGYGRHFQFLGAVKTREVLRFYKGWLDAAAVKYGGRQIDGLPKDNDQINALWAKARFSGESSPAIINVALQSDFGLDIVSQRMLNGTASLDEITGHESWVQDAVYSDYW